MSEQKAQQAYKTQIDAHEEIEQKNNKETYRIQE